MHSEQPKAEQPNSQQPHSVSAVPSEGAKTALPDVTRHMVTRARRIVFVLEANETVPTDRVICLLRDMADALQYGDCSYWCPACYAEVSKPQHRVGASQ